MLNLKQEDTQDVIEYLLMKIDAKEIDDCLIGCGDDGFGWHVIEIDGNNMESIILPSGRDT